MHRKSSLIFIKTTGTVHLPDSAHSPFEGTAFSCPVWSDMNNDGLLDLLLPGLNDWNYAWLDGDTQFDQIKTHLYIDAGNSF